MDILPLLERLKRKFGVKMGWFLEGAPESCLFHKPIGEVKDRFNLRLLSCEVFFFKRELIASKWLGFLSQTKQRLCHQNQ